MDYLKVTNELSSDEEEQSTTSVPTESIIVLSVN